MTIRLTAKTLSKPDDLTIGQSLAWNYYDFGRTWQVFLTGDETVIVTDESCDLELMSLCFPCFDSFLDWLEAETSDRLESDLLTDRQSFIGASMKFPESMITADMAEAFLRAVEAERSTRDHKSEVKKED